MYGREVVRDRSNIWIPPCQEMVRELKEQRKSCVVTGWEWDMGCSNVAYDSLTSQKVRELKEERQLRDCKRDQTAYWNVVYDLLISQEVRELKEERQFVAEVRRQAQDEVPMYIGVYNMDLHP